MTPVPTARARRYLDDAGRAFVRAPVEVAVALAVASAFSYAVELGDYAVQTWVEIAIAGALIMAGAWTGTLLHALGAWNEQRRWTCTVAVAVIVALYALLVLDFARAAEAWRALMLIAAALLWLAAAPAVRGQDGDATERMRLVTGRVLLRAIGALLYCAALFAGLALALGAVNTLFELDLSSTIYAHAFGWIFLALATWIIVGGLPDYVRPPESMSAVGSVVQRMSAFLVPPLLALYYVILYAYMIRIAVTGEVPKNLVSPMVLAAGVLAAAALFLFAPAPEERNVARVLRFAPPLFLPLGVLGAVTVWLRVDQYGWTEFRLLRLLLLVLFVVLAAAATFALARRRAFTLHRALFATAAVLLLAAAGPWSVMATARASQQQRLADTLRQVGIDPATPVVVDTSRTREVPADVHDEISNLTRYLATHHDVHALPAALAAVVPDRETVYDAATRLGLRRAPDPESPTSLFGRLPYDTPVRLDGRMVMRVTAARRTLPGNAGRDEAPVAATSGAARISDAATVRIHLGSDVLTADLTAVAGSLQNARTARPERSGELAPASAVVDVVDATGVSRGVLLLLDVNLVMENGVARLRHVDAVLLLR